MPEHEDSTVSTVPTVSTVTAGGAGSTVSTVPTVPTVTTEGAEVLDELRKWWGRFVLPLDETALDLLALWTAHTHTVEHQWSSPRLEVTSPLPAAGKTTVLEHANYLCHRPLLASSGLTPAFMGRLLAEGPRTLLLDEAHRTLSPDLEGTDQLLAFINGGYKRGAVRPVLEQIGGKWIPSELPMFCAFGWAGVAPNLPDDTRSRTLTVDMLPDRDGLTEETDWQVIEPEALQLRERLSVWAETIGDRIKQNPVPELPEQVRGRHKEKWRPLKQVADAAGGRWPELCNRLAEADLERIDSERDSGMVREHPALMLLRDMSEYWPSGVEYWPTSGVADMLRAMEPDRWGATDRFPNGLTVQRVGRYLGRQFKLHPVRGSTGERLGYSAAALGVLCSRLGIQAPTGVTVETVETSETVGSGPVRGEVPGRVPGFDPAAVLERLNGDAR